jgi:hypothetical protein
MLNALFLQFAAMARFKPQKVTSLFLRPTHKSPLSTISADGMLLAK